MRRTRWHVAPFSCARAGRPPPAIMRSHVDLERGDERLLRDFDLAELAHALLAFLLLLQKLALARHVAAIAFGGDVLAQRAHGLARDDLAADGGLDRHLNMCGGMSSLSF